MYFLLFCSVYSAVQHNNIYVPDNDLLFGLPIFLFFFFLCVRVCRVFVRGGRRMFVVYYSPLHLFEVVASRCRLSYHSYLREVGGDGSVLGGVELETTVVHEGGTSARFFFWSSAMPGSGCPYEESALQAVRFLQNLYGFVVQDFNYQAMQAYRDLARSAVVLAVSVGQLGGLASWDDLDGCVGPGIESACWQNICNQLTMSMCNI
jgi:hypothetical protein